MTQGTLQKYGVTFSVTQKIKPVTFLEVAKKHIVKTQLSKKEHLSENIDTLLYGK
jgi:hypothetical protein